MECTKQTQNDFAFLHAKLDELDAESVRGDELMKTCDVEAYAPVNCIKPEVYAMIAAWEACELLPRMKLVDKESGDTLIDICETCSTSCAPPKRYYLTFWRSVTRRILNHC
jgi:hypothetical protein